MPPARPARPHFRPDRMPERGVRRRAGPGGRWGRRTCRPFCGSTAGCWRRTMLSPQTAHSSARRSRPSSSACAALWGCRSPTRPSPRMCTRGEAGPPLPALARSSTGMRLHPLACCRCCGVWCNVVQRKMDAQGIEASMAASCCPTACSCSWIRGSQAARGQCGEPPSHAGGPGGGLPPPQWHHCRPRLLRVPPPAPRSRPSLAAAGSSGLLQGTYLLDPPVVLFPFNML